MLSFACSLFTVRLPLMTCADVNECQAGTDNCDSNANCTNTMGSFTCACKTGYQGDGVSCSGE